MKITNKILENIIREEIAKLMEEEDPITDMHGRPEYAEDAPPAMSDADNLLYLFDRERDFTGQQLEDAVDGIMKDINALAQRVEKLERGR